MPGSGQITTSSTSREDWPEGDPKEVKCTKRKGSVIDDRVSSTMATIITKDSPRVKKESLGVWVQTLAPLN